MTDGSTEPALEERNIGAQIAQNLQAYTTVTTDFYRGEVDRMTTWRARLDQTTNWAVVVAAAILTWAFSGADHPHYVILIGVFGITGFLLMEANRYREYDVWRDRVRTIQTELLADVYAPQPREEGDWQAELSEELHTPTFDVSFVQALNHRLRRSYLALLLLLLVAWTARITVFKPKETWEQTASVLLVPGEVVVVGVAAFYVTVVGVALWSARDSRTQEFDE
jgi:uncharacterized membrane protein